MPRFVRPAWLSVEGRGTGPRDRRGWLSAQLTLRTADGLVSDGIDIQAGGMSHDGSAMARIDIPKGFSVTVAARGVDTEYAFNACSIEIRPLAD